MTIQDSHCGEYALVRRTNNEGSHNHHTFSEWEHIPRYHPNANGFPDADEYSEQMAELVRELEAVLLWKRSRKIRRMRAAYDTADWDRLRIYKQFIANPEYDIDAIDFAVDAVELLEQVPAVIDAHIQCAGAVNNALMEGRREANYEQLLPEQERVKIQVRIISYAITRMESLGAITEILRQRPDITDTDDIDGLVAVYQGTKQALQEGAL